MRHLVDSLSVEAADARVSRECLVVQYITAVADGVDRDGPDEALFDGKARGAANRRGAAPEQAAESVFRVEEPPCVVRGVTGGKTADDGHDKRDKGSTVVAGLSVVGSCFHFVGNSVGV